MTWSTLIQCEELLPRLDAADVRILDVRVNLADRAQGRALYAAGHLPGAFFADLEDDLSNMREQGAGRHPWPRAEEFARTLARWGVTPQTQVVTYDADAGMFAARAWCLLRMAGHDAVAVLDGGYARWTALGYPVTQDVPATHAGEPQTLQFDHERLFDADDTAAHLAHGGLLVDARAPERFRGDVEPLDRKAGHVPGALNRPFMRNLGEDGRFKPRDVLFREFGELLGGHTPSDLVAMCGSGVTACHNLLAMAHAGLEGAKLYAGSWSGWISDDSRPIATAIE